MKLRDATAADLEPITKLIIVCSEKFILPAFSEAGVRNYLESHSLENMRVRLEQFHYQVLDDPEHGIIGVVGMRRPSHLFHLHVAPAFHGRGLGRSLWEAAKTLALAHEPSELFTVNASMYAVPFYEKLGFVASQMISSRGVSYVPMTFTV